MFVQSKYLFIPAQTLVGTLDDRRLIIIRKSIVHTLSSSTPSQLHIQMASYTPLPQSEADSLEELKFEQARQGIFIKSCYGVFSYELNIEHRVEGPPLESDCVAYWFYRLVYSA